MSWTAHEIHRFNRRLDTFLGLDMAPEHAEQLAQSMLHRDRPHSGDDRRVCLECSHLSGSRCRAWGASPVQKFEPCKTVLWRCDQFNLKGNA